MSQTSKPDKAVSAVIIKNDKVLLVKRGKQPLMNTWHLPGGKVENGEDSKKAIVREVFEETCLKLISPKLLGEAIVSGNENDKDYHYSIKIFTGNVDNKKPQARSDAKDLEFAPISELGKYQLSEKTIEFIDKAICHQTRKHTLKGHLRVSLIALFFGLAAYAFLFALMKILRATGFQVF